MSRTVSPDRPDTTGPAPSSAERRAIALRRVRSRERRTGIGIGAALALPVVVIVAILVFASVLSDAFARDFSVGDAGPSAPLPPLAIQPRIAGYGVEQLSNACTIIGAGRDLGLDERDQTIAVMTAMGESSLRNIDYGDWETSGVRNPDGSPTTSIGLFQQQDEWGAREARLDPYTSATLFYRAMLRRVPDRASIEPTLVAHRTQVNADPLHYARYWDRAVRVVAAVNAVPIDGDSIDGIPLCPAA